MLIDDNNSLQKNYNFDVLQDICSTRVENANFFLGVYETLGDCTVESAYFREEIAKYKLYDV